MCPSGYKSRCSSKTPYHSPSPLHLFFFSLVFFPSICKLYRGSRVVWWKDPGLWGFSELDMNPWQWCSCNNGYPWTILSFFETFFLICKGQQEYHLALRTMKVKGVIKECDSIWGTLEIYSVSFFSLSFRSNTKCIPMFLFLIIPALVLIFCQSPSL